VIVTFDGSGVDSLLTSAVHDGAFAGVSAIVVDRDRVLHLATAGEANADTVYRNASMTKAPATIAALQLVEQGRLDLDATVESIVPAFAQLQVLTGFDADVPVLRPPASKATVRQLMTHTSGCGYTFTNAALHRYAQLTGTLDLFTGMKASLMGPLARDPGTLWEYGVSTDWLGLVVEAVSGHTLDVYLREHVFGPLGMSETTFSPTTEQRSRLPALRLRAPDGRLEPLDVDLPVDPEWASAGHGSYGTIGDYGRFIRAMLRDGELDDARVLNADTVELAFTDQLRGVPLPELMKSADPMLTNDVPALPVPQGWGLGFQLLLADIPGRRTSGTGYWAGLFNCYYWIDRAAGVGGALMTQVLPFFDMRIVQVAADFEAAIYSQLGSAAPAA
jgi:CubicO group peptidase (beta-lactamase class C family)